MLEFSIFEMDAKELGYYFYQQRIKYGYTLREASKLSGVNVSSITQFENGKGVLPNYRIKQLSELLKIELKYCLIK